MNTKTSLKRVYNYYNGTEHGVGRDSPGALLDMLAEVASQTLHSEKKWTESSSSSSSSGIELKSQLQQAQMQSKSKSNKSNKSKSKYDSLVKRKSNNNNNNQQEQTFDSSQLLSMPATQLVKQFSIFTSDELKRQYSYTCALVPGCSQRYTSFASEGRARMSIKAHLADHLDYLKKDEEAYSTFTAAVAVKHNNKNSKSINHQGVNNNNNKKTRISNEEKKPTIVETSLLNKENDKDNKCDKSTNYLRKILSNEMNFDDFEKEKNFLDNKIHNNCSGNDNVDVKKEVISNDNGNDDHNHHQNIEFQVLGDHSYYGQAKIIHDNDHRGGNGRSDLEEIIVPEVIGENIMLMVVESDGVHMKEVPYIASDISVATEHDDTETIYLPEPSVNWSEEVKNMEISVPAKPKGKAKFIGTSKEEREMALALMERIKRKGNPSGGNLQCRICDPPRSFTAPTTLVSHYRSHAGIKPYECRICRAVFTRRHSLKYHMLIHQNQTRFTCADCGKKFRHPSHFREHRRRHTGEAPFGCEDCGQRFKTRNTYKRHLKTRHGKVLTTTGELLHLSEEDFQKVRTNPKRKVCDTNLYTESMIDEDITAPEVIIQLQNQDDDNETKGESLKNYESLIQESKLWENENRIEEEDEEDEEEEEEEEDIENGNRCSRDYEYFEESHQINKTDYNTKTDVNLDNCEFENIENVVNDDTDENKDNECISICMTNQDDDNIREIQLLEENDNDNEGTIDFHNEECIDHHEEILYDDNDKGERNVVQYIEESDIQCGVEEDVIAYDDGMEILQGKEVIIDNDYQLEGNIEEQTEEEIDYFQNNINIENEGIQFEEVNLNMERYEEINIVEEANNESLQSDIHNQLNSEELFIDSEEQNESFDDKREIADDVNEAILQEEEEEEDLRNFENNITEGISENEYVLGGTEADLEEQEEQQFLLNNKDESNNIRENVSVERIVEYPGTLNYEEVSENEKTTIMNIDKRSIIYLQSSNNPASSNIILKNKDLVNLLSHGRIRIGEERKSTDKLEGLLERKNNAKVVTILNSQQQSSSQSSFNMIQNSKQGTILLLTTSTSNNDVKNNYLQINSKPVITVQQK